MPFSLFSLSPDSILSAKHESRASNAARSDANGYECKNFTLLLPVLAVCESESEVSET
jgi:hypothetical protein